MLVYFGPPSATLAQNYSNIGSTSLVCLVTLDWRVSYLTLEWRHINQKTLSATLETLENKAKIKNENYPKIAEYTTRHHFGELDFVRFVIIDVEIN